MNQPDLTPSPFLKRSMLRTAMQRWALVVATVGLIAAVPIGIETARVPDSSAARAQERYALAQNRLVQSRAKMSKIDVKLKQHERELQAEEHLTQRPDWSGVLRLVAGRFDDRLMMSGFRLGAIKDSQVRSALGPIAQDVPDTSVWLILDGVALANSDVPGLILKLEELGLFERVVMTQTQRERFSGSSRTGFTLACRVE